jgi:N6-adenosine-specific RNA methylase IME4
MSDTFDDLSPPYITIVADPPWPIRWNGGAGGRRARALPLAYSLMTVDDIAAMPVASIAAADAHLFLWVTAEHNRRGAGVQVAEAWGFRVAGEIVWEKPNLGMGAMPRICHEIMLVCTRGSVPWLGPRNVRSVQKWPQVYDRNGGKGHSRKPAAALDLVELVSPGPYVELFARTPRLGWDSWGWGYETPGPKRSAAL